MATNDNMFPHLWETDYRDPAFTFSLGQTYAFYLPSIPFWLEILGALSLQMILACFVALIIFKFIIKPRKFESSFSLLLTYGVILPLWIVWPAWYIQLFDFRHYIFKFLVGVTTTLCLFRTTEAAHGFTPAVTTTSAKDYCIYYCSVLHFSRDKNGNFIKCSMNNTLGYAFKFILLLFFTGTLQSMMAPHKNMSMFGAPIDSLEEWYSHKRFFTWELYANSAFHALLFQSYLATFCEGMVLVWAVATRCQVEPVMLNPLFKSQSPLDFWSKRWNLLVHRVLKGGVYKPVRKHSSAIMAILASFIASGLFHEWLLYFIFIPLPHHLDDSGSCTDCFMPSYGYASLFFIWQAVLVALEISVGRSSLFSPMKRLPSIVRTFLIVASGIPLAHAFCEPYVRSDFFRHGQIAFPMISPIPGP